MKTIKKSILEYEKENFYKKNLNDYKVSKGLNNNFVIIIRIEINHNYLRHNLKVLLENNQNIAEVIILNFCKHILSKEIKELINFHKVKVINNTATIEWKEKICNLVKKDKKDIIIINSSIQITKGWSTNLNLCANINRKFGVITPMIETDGKNTVKHSIVPSWISKTKYSNVLKSISYFYYPKVNISNYSCIYLKNNTLKFNNFLTKTNYSVNDIKKFIFKSKLLGWKTILDDATLVIEKINNNNYVCNDSNNKIKRNIKNKINHNFESLHNNYEYISHISKDTLLFISYDSQKYLKYINKIVSIGLENKYRILILLLGKYKFQLLLHRNKQLNLIVSDSFDKLRHKRIFEEKFLLNIIKNYNVSAIHAINLNPYDLRVVNNSKGIGFGLLYSFVEGLQINLLNFRFNTKPQLKYLFLKKINKKRLVIDKLENCKTVLKDIDCFIVDSIKHKLQISNIFNLDRNKINVSSLNKVIKHKKQISSKRKVLFPIYEFNNEVKNIIDYITKLNAEYDNQLDLEYLNFYQFNSNNNLFEANICANYLSTVKPCCIVFLNNSVSEILMDFLNVVSNGIPVILNDNQTLKELLSSIKIQCYNINFSVHNEIRKLFYEYLFDYHKIKKYKTKFNMFSKSRLQLSNDYYNCIYQESILSNLTCGKHKYEKTVILTPNRFCSYYLRIKNNLTINNNSLYIFDLTIFEFFQFTKIADIESVVVQRHAIDPCLTDFFINYINYHKINLIFEIDDNLFEINEYYNYYSESLRKIAQNASAICVPSMNLKNVISKITDYDKIFLVPNYINYEYWNRPKLRINNKKDNFVVLYMGTKSHDEDLDIILESIKLLNHNYNITLKILGVANKINENQFLKQIKMTNEWEDYPKFVKYLMAISKEMDFAVAPLVKNKKNLCKSSIKYLDYSALGLPGIYSNISPYSDIVQNKINGILTENTTESWYRNIEYLCKYPNERKRISMNAMKTVINEYNIENQSFPLREVFNKVKSK